MEIIEKLNIDLFEGKMISAQEIIIGTIVSISDGDVFVDFPENPLGTPLKTLCTVPIDEKSVTRKVALLFINGSLLTPVLIGLIRQTSLNAITEFNPLMSQKSYRELSFVSLERITFECGQSSMIMNRDGKIVIKGKTISSYADGVNRVRGAVVEIN